MKTIRETDLAYTAGIIDGEGTIGVYSFHRKGRGLQFSTRIAVINTHIELLRWVKRMYGGNIVPKTKTAKTSKRCWELQIYGEDADRIARLIRPYVKLKKEQLKIFCKMRQRQRSRAAQRPRKRLFPWEVKERMAWIRRMRILNKQGAS